MRVLTALELKNLTDILNKSGVIIMPTDTVYGLVCSAKSLKAVKSMYRLKQRENKPGTIIVASTRQLIDLGFDPKEVNNANSMFWPAPVSVILDAPKKLEYLHMGKESLAVRIPEPQWLRDLLEISGPLATTSANLPGEPPVESIDEAELIFGKRVSLYIDGGIIPDAKSSRIVKITKDDIVETLRA